MATMASKFDLQNIFMRDPAYTEGENQYRKQLL